MKYLFSLIFLWSLGNGLFAQTITRLDGNQLPVKEIDARIRQWMQEENIQGLCVSVLNQQQPVLVKAYGYRNQPKNEYLDTATIMYGASLSKGVFGYLVMQLVDKGILNLDKPLYQYLPKPLYEYEYFADLKSDDRWKQITARMCLSHTTGLPNLRWFHPTTNVEDTTGFLRIYFNPGSRYAYSGEGFKLLQLVIETITQKTVDALAVEYIFNPLGMKRTGYVWHDSFGDDNVAVGHMNNGAIDKKKKRSTAVA
ncbi:MAG TPA: serine hydrolase, partial [Ferruginibacter sp.]|nr:serine hydrolase [Ferruginibacter sp.]